MSRTFAAVIDDTLREWRAARRRVLRRNAGQSAVHAWRICSRQLFALEQLLGVDTRGQRAQTLRAELHQSFHASGQLRDTQLAIPRLEQLAPAYATATRLARHLRQETPRLRRHAVKRVRSAAPRALRREIRTWGDPHSRDFEQIARNRAARRLAQTARSLLAAHGVPKTTRSLHRRRIRLKSLRYMTEMCEAADGRGGQSMAPGKLADLQAAMGKIMDIQVLLRNIDEYGRRHHRWRSQASPLRIHLRHQRLRLMERLQ